MKLNPKVTKTAVELVKRFEGLRRRAARLPDGGWTIGYGHTLTAREGAEVNEQEAELLLYYDLSEVATKVEAWTFAPLNQNQFEALTAFAFNIGPENFRRSTVLKRVNEGQYLQAAAAMELWRKTDVDGEGVVVDALVRRRATEKAHFLTPPDGFKPSPTPVVKPSFDFSVIEAAAQSRAAQHTAEIDAPMEGRDAIAHVERSEPSPVETHQETPTAPEAPVVDTLHTAEPVANAWTPAFVAAAAIAPEVLHEHEPPPLLTSELSAEPEHDQTDEAVAHAVDEDDLSATAQDTLAVPPAPDAPPSSSFGFRGFEPPSRRLDGHSDWPPLPANTPFEPETVQPSAGHVVPATPDLGTDHTDAPINLFDRPLPRVSELPVERVIRSARDDDAAHGEGMGKILNNAAVLFGSVGCLGVLLFALTITSMLTGKASVAHLLVGLVGVALMTFAGIYFLMKRSGGSAGDPHSFEPYPGEDQPQ